MRNRVSSSFLLALLLALVATTAFADDVHLKNGRKFEGVIAEVTESQVRIRLQGGVLSLPKSQVLRVEKGDSPLAEYLQRKEALRRGANTRAGDWLDLARWARTQGLEQGAREAALAAAELDPKLAGLEPILRSFRFAYDEQLGRWISYEESMRRRGFVFAGGVWISREELAERDRQREEEASRRRAAFESARSERTARQTELLLATQTALLEETLRERQSAPPWLSPYTPYGWPVVVVPGGFPPRCHSCDPPSHGGDGKKPHHPREVRGGNNTFTRIPGSLIPGELGGTRSSSSSPKH
jgi:hypothetical protein